MLSCRSQNRIEWHQVWHDGLYVKDPLDWSEPWSTSNLETFRELVCCPVNEIDKHSIPIQEHSVLGSLGVLASETAAGEKTFALNIFESSSTIQTILCMGSTHASLRTAVPYHQMLFNALHDRHGNGATICLPQIVGFCQLTCAMSPCQGWQDLCRLRYDTLRYDTPRLVPNSELLDILDIRRENRLCLPEKQGGTPPQHEGKPSHHARKVTRKF